MERVHFTAPASRHDLRLVVSQHSATAHDHHQITITGRFGEVRSVQWLTKLDAHERARVLRRRGYTVHVSTMAV